MRSFVSAGDTGGIRCGINADGKVMGAVMKIIVVKMPKMLSGIVKTVLKMN